jgi:hypothetical protein
MWHMIPFWAVFATSCLYAFWGGGAPERWAAACCVVAFIVTVLTADPAASRFRHFETGIFVADLGLLLAFVAIAIRSRRYWPIWLAACQLLAVGGHLFPLVSANAVLNAYATAQAMWSWPIVLGLTVATFRHRERLRRRGYDYAWKAVPERRRFWIARKAVL